MVFELDINPYCQEVSTGYRSTRFTIEEPVATITPRHSPSRKKTKAKRHRDFPGLYFRSILPIDRQQIQRLHEEWFPVEYQEKFYDTLVHGKLVTPRHDRRPKDENDVICDEDGALTRPLFTYLACVDDCATWNDDSNVNNDNEEYGSGGNEGVDVAVAQPDSTFTDDDIDEEKFDCTKEHRIAACIVGAKVELGVLPPNLRQLLVPQPHIHSKLFYIMTLGTADDYRGMGLASYLVLQCIQQEIENDQSCGTLYLHVLDTNYAAIQFYEKLGFYCVRLIPNYYTIDGKLRHCYLYAKYFHGNTGHLTLLDMVKRGIHSLWRTLVRTPSDHWDRFQSPTIS
jgi:ribosomal protein S18 acetylase RimI-like enzyme